ncbi:pentatricopeptide repeat-containing At3g23020 [Olea europaea subsp. europaea]|uniref:Pentatricopeptide repeat-containing At3g23020 n=1 Tax=Olea europaea subsp. europaea TaxID=158383 RepID=A0A8S0Q017_OLEEU|nr:pentatricopeptide repeat-containing At3g23020 [Olea europaea subsp. europaea]
MFVRFQYLDANTLNSTKTSSLNVAFVATPPFMKSNDQTKQKQYQQVLEWPNGGKMAKKIGFVNNRDGIIKENGKVGLILRSGNDINGVVEKLHPHCSPENGGKKAVFKKDKVSENVIVKNPGGRTKSNRKITGEMRSRNAGEKVKAKCSMKWGRYGGSVLSMLESLQAVNDLDEALKPWEKSLTNKERSIILKEQLEWKRALQIFEWFKRNDCAEVNVIHYNIMLRILGKAQQWGEVERLLGEMGERRIELINSTYGTLIDVCSKGGLTEEARKWLKLMTQCGMEPDEVTMGIVVQMYKKTGEFKKAEEFFKKWSFTCKMDGRNAILGNKRVVDGDSGANVRLSAYTYNTLIDTYGKAGQVKEACRTFEEMLKRGILPTTVTFNTMIHMYGNNCQLDEVDSLMKKMEKFKCSPDTRTYNILISLHAKYNNIEMSAKYLKKMKDASLEPDAVSYRTLLYAFSIRHMVGEAEELISEMDERGLEIDEFTQSSLTRMYIEAGMLESSWSWFERFHLAGNMTSECYSANIDAFGERGHILEAEKVFSCCLEAKKMSVLVFNVMIKAYGISKRFDQACCIFDSMEKHGIVPDKCSYNSLVQMLAGADLPEKAKFYVRKMQEAGLVTDCIPYSAVISSYAKLGNMDVAEGLYKEMIEIGLKPDVVVYGVLLNAFADTGSVKEAIGYVNTMRDLDIPMNAVICKSLIKLYTKVGYLKEAHEAYVMLQSYEEGLDVYSSNCMIDLYSERSMISQAEQIFENMKRNGDANEFTYAMMLCMYKRNGRFVEAFQIACKMRELGFMTDLLSYNHVLGLYASDGRFKEAAATFDEMLRSAVQPDDSTFKSLGIILLKCGVPKDALRKLELMRKKDAQSGLQAWNSTLCSVIGMDNDTDVCANDV